MMYCTRFHACLCFVTCTHSHFALRGGFAVWDPAGVGMCTVSLRRHGVGGAETRALRLVALQELLGLAVVQRGGARLERHGVRAHAGVKPRPSTRLQLSEIFPVKIFS